MTKLSISSISPASSVQDGGRFGAQRYGLTPGGAMDRLGLAAANCLVGNALFAPAIEIGPYGAAFKAREGAVRLAMAGTPRVVEIAGVVHMDVIGCAPPPGRVHARHSLQIQIHNGDLILLDGDPLG